MITMQQFLQFIQNHWALSSAFLVVLALLIFEELKNKIGGIPRVSPQNATIMLNREDAVVVDLRNQSAFENGHILGAINIVHADFAANIKKIESYKNRTLILVADQDSNAASIGAKLQKQNFTKIYVLTGGIQAWQSSSLPLTKT
jgi:rhodanese-related sulfurtransferase